VCVHGHTKVVVCAHQGGGAWPAEIVVRVSLTGSTQIGNSERVHAHKGAGGHGLGGWCAV